jgi:hypothetical protein
MGNYLFRPLPSYTREVFIIIPYKKEFLLKYKKILFHIKIYKKVLYGIYDYILKIIFIRIYFGKVSLK